MQKFLVLLKKEIKELITIQMILPLIIMVMVFSMIGGLMSKEAKKAAAPQSLWVVNEDQSETAEIVLEVLEQANFKVSSFNEDIDSVLLQARQENVLAVLVIPAGFGQSMDNFKAQKLKVYNLVNNFSLTSAIKSGQVIAAVNIVSQYFQNEWLEKNEMPIPIEELKNPVGLDEFVVIGDRQAQVPLSQVMNFIRQQTFFIPIILFFVIVIAAQMVAMAVASEKENKTFETLLSSPINRKTIVFAKLIAAGVVAILFAGFYMFGFNYYIKGLTGGAVAPGSETISQALASLGIVFETSSYALLGVSLFLGILVALSIAMILGIMAESVKSVQAVTTPLMVLVLVPYLLVMFLDFNTLSPVIKYIIYAIPFSHPFLAAQKIITQDYLFIIYGIIYQLIIFLIFVFIAAKIFSSDKILTLRLGRKK